MFPDYLSLLWKKNYIPYKNILKGYLGQFVIVKRYQKSLWNAIQLMVNFL